MDRTIKQLAVVVAMRVEFHRYALLFSVSKEVGNSILRGEKKKSDVWYESYRTFVPKMVKTESEGGRRAT